MSQECLGSKSANICAVNELQKSYGESGSLLHHLGLSPKSFPEIIWKIFRGGNTYWRIIEIALADIDTGGLQGKRP